MKDIPSTPNSPEDKQMSEKRFEIFGSKLLDMTVKFHIPFS